MFKGPQGMSLTGAVDVSVRSMFQHSWYIYIFFFSVKKIFWPKNKKTKKKSTVLKHWSHRNINCAGERHSLRAFKHRLRRLDSPEGPASYKCLGNNFGQISPNLPPPKKKKFDQKIFLVKKFFWPKNKKTKKSTVLKHWSHRNINRAGERHSLRAFKHRLRRIDWPEGPASSIKLG